MSFKALFIAHAPDADYTQNNSVIETGKYKLISYVVKTQDEAIKVAKEVHQTEEIHAVMLCPGFTHNDVAGIFNALNGKVGVTVARGDGPSSMITGPVLQQEFFS